MRVAFIKQILRVDLDLESSKTERKQSEAWLWTNLDSHNRLDSSLETRSNLDLERHFKVLTNVLS